MTYSGLAAVLSALAHLKYTCTPVSWNYLFMRKRNIMIKTGPYCCLRVQAAGHIIISHTMNFITWG